MNSKSLILNKITKETFLQRTLGDNYKWYFLLRFRLKSRSVSSWDSVFFVIGHFLILAGTLLTWWLASGKIIDFNLREKFSYFIIGELFFSLTFTFAEFMGFEFLRGSHNADLLKPQDYIKMKFVSYYGEALLQNLTKFIILLIFVFILAQSRLISPNFYSFFLNIIYLPIPLFILFFTGFIVACSGFFLKAINGITLNYTFLSSLLMGRSFPLNLLIDNFWLNLANPFAFTFYHPMQIYLGKYDNFQTFLVFLGGILWCILLYFLAKLVFKMGLKRNESVGL